MSTMLRGSANGGGRGPPDRRPKPGLSKAGSATEQRRGRKRRRQSSPVSERSATPSCDGRGRKEDARPAPGPARRSSRRVSSSGFASHNRTDTAQRRSTRTVDASSNYSSTSMLQQHFSNRRNRYTQPIAQSITRPNRRMSNPAPLATTITTTSTAAAAAAAPPTDDAQSVVIVEDTPARSVVVDDDVPSIYDVDDWDTPNEFNALRGQTAIAGSANPFVVNDDPPPAAVTAAEVRTIVAEELEAHGVRLLGQIGTLLAARTSANPQDEGKGKGRAT